MFERPPDKLIKADSKDDQEEDFANYIEKYVLEKEEVKKFNSNVFDFVEKIIK